jgi:hypothetical protein
MQSIRRLGTVVAAVVATLTATALPAQAAVARPAGAVTHTNHFAGYEVTADPTSGTITVVLPTITCGSSFSAVNAFIGFNNFTTNDYTSGGVAMTCYGGSAFYQAYTEINNDSFISPQEENPGDTVTVSVSTSATSSSVTVDDATDGASTVSTVSGPGGGGTFQSVSVGAGGEGKPSNPAPTFGSIPFSAMKVNGVAIGSAGPTFKYQWYTHKVLQVASTTLKSGGSSITVSQPT